MNLGQEGGKGRSQRGGGGKQHAKKGKKSSEPEEQDLTVNSSVTNPMSEEDVNDVNSVVEKESGDQNDDQVDEERQEEEVRGKSARTTSSNASYVEDEAAEMSAKVLMQKQDIIDTRKSADNISTAFLSAKSESEWASATLNLDQVLKSSRSNNIPAGLVLKRVCTSLNDKGNSSYLSHWEKKKLNDKIEIGEALKFMYDAVHRQKPASKTIESVVDFAKAAGDGRLWEAVSQATTLFSLRFDPNVAKLEALRVALSAASKLFPTTPQPREETVESMEEYIEIVTQLAWNISNVQSASKQVSTPSSSATASTSASSAGTVAVVSVQGDGRRVFGNARRVGRGGARGGRGRSQSGPQCFECGGFGHIARNCGNKRGNKKRNRQSSDESNDEVKNDKEYGYRSFYSGLPSLELCEPLSILAAVSVRGVAHPQRVWIDTGAVPALVSPALCERLGMKPLASRAKHVRSVSGELIAVQGEVAVRLLLGGVGRGLTALVVATPFDLLVGVKVMRQFGVSIVFDRCGARVRMAGSRWVKAYEPGEEESREAASRDGVLVAGDARNLQTQQQDVEPQPLIEVTAPSVNLVVGCEERVAQVLRAESSQEGAAAMPWTLPRLAAASMYDDDGDVDHLIGQPALTGSDVEAFRRVKFGDLSPAGLAEGQAIAEEYRHIFGGTRGEGASTVPPLCKIDKQIKLTLKPDADLSRVKAHAGRVSAAEIEVMDKFVNDMLAAGALEPAPDAPCSSKAFVVHQGDKARVVVDFSPMNKLTFNNANLIPRMDDIIEHMASADYEYRSKFDFFGMYYAFQIEENSRPLTATLFMTKKGPMLYQWTRVPLGLSPVPGILHPLMVMIFELDFNFRQFFDDSNARHKNEKQCLIDFRRFCAKVHETGLTISADKCWVGFRRLEILGKMVGPGSIEPLPEHLNGIRDLARPTTVKQLQSLLGMFNALTPHLQPRLGQALAPLEGAKGGRGPLQWTDAMERAFVEAKRIMMSPEVVVPFDEARPLILITDASNIGGTCTFCHLSRDESRFEIIDSFGHKFSQAERNWQHISQRELLMLLLARRRAPHLLVGRPVYWVNDTFTMSQAIQSDRPSTSRRILRTLLELSDVDIRVIPVRGDANKIGDALSRNPAWGDDEQASPGAVSLPDGLQLNSLVAVLDDVIEREEGEVAVERDDDGALQAFSDEFDDPVVAGDEKDEVEEELMRGVGTRVLAAPQGRPPVVFSAANGAAPVDEADMQFDLGISQDAQRARFLQRQHEDLDLTELRNEAERRRQARARGELRDDFEVLDGASWFVRLRPELDPFELLYVCVGDERHWRLVVPKGCRDEVLHSLHAGQGVGHWGQRRVLATARRFFWWLDMYSDVVRWCRQCVPCQRVRKVPAPGNLGDSEQPGEPSRFEVLAMDSFVIGGVHFLSIVELFSGLVVTAPLRDQTSESLAQAFEQAWLMYFGPPKSIHADGGAEFKKHCAALCVARGIALEPGTPHNPESVARVSRAQRTLQAVISKRRAEGSTLPIAVLVAEAAEAINTAPSDDQWHISSHQLLFGSAPRIPLVAFMDVDLTGLRNTSPLAPLRDQLQSHSKTLSALAEVRHQQREERRQRSEQSYARTHGAEFRPEPGDWVWAHLPVDVNKSKDEMLLCWSGPWEVTAFDEQHQRIDMCFVLASGEAKALAKSSVHVRRVRPFSRVVPIDDTVEIDKSVVPLQWESRAAPLGGLSLQPEGVQNVLRKAAELAEKQAKQADVERRRAEEKEREAQRQRAEAARQAELAAERQREQARQLEKAARAREQKAQRDSVINKVLDVVRDSDGVKKVVVERNDASRVEIRRDDELFNRGGRVRDLILDYEARMRSRTAGQRALRAARGVVTR